MMCLQNKMVKTFGAQMCYETFWAPRLLDRLGLEMYILNADIHGSGAGYVATLVFQSN